MYTKGKSGSPFKIKDDTPCQKDNPSSRLPVEFSESSSEQFMQPKKQETQNSIKLEELKKIIQV